MYAYTLDNRSQMETEIHEIIDVCRSTENSHFCWFANLLENHLDGITAHATYSYSSGKVEGTMNKIVSAEKSLIPGKWLNGATVRRYLVKQV